MFFYGYVLTQLPGEDLHHHHDHHYSDHYCHNLHYHHNHHLHNHHNHNQECSSTAMCWPNCRGEDLPSSLEPSGCLVEVVFAIINPMFTIININLIIAIDFLGNVSLTFPGILVTAVFTLLTPLAALQSLDHPASPPYLLYAVGHHQNHQNHHPSFTMITKALRFDQPYHQNHRHHPTFTMISF